MNALLATLNPYAFVLKVAGVAIILGSLVFGGCRWQAKVDAGKLVDKDATIAVLVQDKNFLADALNEVNAKADQAKRDAAAQADKAKDAVADAADAAKQYQRDLAEAERALLKAGKTPACRAQLEAPLCADLL